MALSLKSKFFFFLIIFLVQSAIVYANDNQSTLKIISPKNGDIVTATIEIKYELQKGTQGDHVHVYVDGKYQKGFKGVLSGLKKGQREIILKVANSDHDVLATSAMVTVEVK